MPDGADSDPSSSDGVFVFTGGVPPAATAAVGSNVCVMLLFDADGFTPLLTVDPDGRLASVQIGPTGAVGVETFARAQGGDPAATVTN
jgi:hypothetical protein